MNRAELVARVTRPLYAFHEGGGCADGPRCVWCPAERVVDFLAGEHLVWVDENVAVLRGRVREVLAAHGRVPLDELDQVLDEIETVLGRSTP